MVILVNTAGISTPIPSIPARLKLHRRGRDRPDPVGSSAIFGAGRLNVFRAVTQCVI